MTDIRDAYEGDFLESVDLPEGKLFEVEIEKIDSPNTVRDASKKLIKKAILRFKGRPKALILSTTNYKVLKAMFGLSDTWPGKTIRLQRRYLDAKHGFGHHNEMGIRVIPPTGTPLPKKVREFMGSRTPYPSKES